MSKTTNHMSINALHFRSHSEIFDFRWIGGVFTYDDNSVVLDIAKIADFRDTENSLNFHCYKIPLING